MRCAVGLVCFAAGVLITGFGADNRPVRAGNTQVFELNVYHAVPGKVPKLEERFRDASKLLAKHDLTVSGYWVPESDPAWANTFVYIVAASSREEMEKNWDAFHADPAFQKYLESELAEKLIEKVDSLYMRPTDLSALR